MSEQPVITCRQPWQHQLATAFTDPEQLGSYLQLPADWVQQHAPARKLFPLRVPRHFADLMESGNPDDPLLRQVWPHADEFTDVPGYTTDPLHEADASMGNAILHKYASRLLLIVRGGCAVNCRYCFRRHFPYQAHKFGRQELANVQQYLLADPALNEVILSGGDPLMADDPHLDTILSAIEAVPHIRRIRIHSRLPVVLPDRLTRTLAQRLEQSRLQAVLVIHANHPAEISQPLADAIQHWRQHDIHVLNQSVLLQGINDNVATLSELSEALFAAGVLPYYLHQLDKVAGAAHFAVSDANASLIMDGLRVRLPGFLVPKLVREIAGEPSKTPLAF